MHFLYKKLIMLFFRLNSALGWCGEPSAFTYTTVDLGDIHRVKAIIVQVRHFPHFQTFPWFYVNPETLTHEMQWVDVSSARPLIGQMSPLLIPDWMKWESTHLES